MDVKSIDQQLDELVFRLYEIPDPLRNEIRVMYNTSSLSDYFARIEEYEDSQTVV